VILHQIECAGCADSSKGLLIKQHWTTAMIYGCVHLLFRQKILNTYKVVNSNELKRRLRIKKLKKINDIMN